MALTRWKLRDVSPSTDQYFKQRDQETETQDLPGIAGVIACAAGGGTGVEFGAAGT
jgi:hypothetical protein